MPVELPAALGERNRVGPAANAHAGSTGGDLLTSSLRRADLSIRFRAWERSPEIRAKLRRETALRRAGARPGRFGLPKLGGSMEDTA
jgi:hypothetical protein